MLPDYTATPAIFYEGPEEGRAEYLKIAKSFLHKIKRCTLPTQFGIYREILPDGTFIEVKNNSQFGMDVGKFQHSHPVDVVKIIVPKELAKGEGKKRKITYIDKNITTVEPVFHVLLVEMGPYPEEGQMPKGFTVFVPNKDSKKLTFAGWYNTVLEDSKDPLGLIEQATYRAGWCKFEIPGLLLIEQIKRADQGYLAYSGDPEEGEATACYTADNVWTYEDTRIQVDGPAEYWDYVDPGPPPEDICGYTWSPPGSEEEADYSDLQHLFYIVDVPGLPAGRRLTYWWPLEFNQVIHKFSDYNNEGGAYKATDWETVWYAPYETEGFGAGVLLKNTFTKMRVTTLKKERYWGIIYGTPEFAVSEADDSSSFPYNYIPSVYAEIQHNVHTDYNRSFSSSDGVYVEDGGVPKFFIQGLCRAAGTFLADTGHKLELREKQNPEDLFLHPDEITENQRTLTETGNEDAADFRLDIYTGLYEFAEYWSKIANFPEVCVNCGGVEYPLFSLEHRETKYLGNAFLYQDILTEYTFTDYGIFSKFNKGIEDDKVDPTKIDPVYAYCAQHILENPGGLGNEVKKTLYGMVMDGEHYTTDFFDTVFVEGVGDKVLIPGTENAKKDLEDIYPLVFVRTGVWKAAIKIETEMSVEREEEYD